MRKILLCVLAGILLSFTAQAQSSSGEISGRVTDENGEGIPFANVAVVAGDAVIKGTVTDFDGNYSIKPLDPGKYDIKTSYLGYGTILRTGVVVSVDKTTFLDIALEPQTEIIDEVTVIEYKVPLIDPGETSSKNTMTKEEIEMMPTRNVNTLAATSAGVFQSDEGGALSIRGGRSDATEYFVDGIRVRGSSAVPATAIEQITVISGGVPAKYGDATGGIVSITTKGPSRSYAGEVEWSSSVDGFGYHLVSGQVSGPIAKNKDGKPVFGFFLSGEYLRQKDPDPSAIGVWKVDDAVLADLQQFPLTRTPSGDGFFFNTETVTLDDLEKVKAKPNALSQNFRLQGKFDVKPTDNINITMGGGVIYNQFNQWVERYTLFNPDNNPLYNDYTYRGFVRFTQNIGQRMSADNAEASNSIFQNVYYSIQFDYEKIYTTYEDQDHGRDIFDYGYIGEFNTQRQPIYSFGDHEITDAQGNVIQTLQGQRLIGYADTLVTFNAGTQNALASRYTEHYLELIGTDRVEDFNENIFQFEQQGALINGQRARLAHSIWHTTGRQFNGVGQTRDNDQYRLTFNGSFDILKRGASSRNKHSIEFGFEFQQRINRNYQLSPIGLWTLARQSANRHIATFDTETNNPLLLINGDTFQYNDPNRPQFTAQDTILYLRDYTADLQTTFDRNLRTKLYGDPTNLTFIDVDALSPETLELSMFGADELLENQYVTYQGYDYLGNRTKDVSFNDYFTEQNADGTFKRNIDAFRPIYIAGYIQDKFHFKDLTFNVGVRVDRFDANQKVLRDQYSLYDILTASEVTDINGNPVAHPSTIGEDYAVYVDDINNPTQILGYRDGDQWYDAEGNQLSSGVTIANGSSTGVISPYLVFPESNIKDTDYDPNQTFEDYTPQVTVMPRLQFSFNLTDKALFFAHYDILTQRPSAGLVSTPNDWFYFQNRIGSAFPNPGLKPERTIDFQLGFQQKVSATSAITFTAYYREFRDMIQLVNVFNAYPRDYITFGNLDFGTTKGFSFIYDMRRTGNLRMKINYTIQFAEGTGSSATSQASLVTALQPNLRTIQPLDFDARHTLNVTADYSYASGKDYNGPVIKDKQILANAGVNLTLVARSGTPYTQQINPTPQGLLGVAGRPITEGSLNGSRLPWTFRANIRVYKNFYWNVGGKKEGADPRQMRLQVYFIVQNLFGNANVVNVYRYTGNPDDDGYLASAEGIATSNASFDSESFNDLYSVYINRPGNYSIPRTMRFGAIIGF